MDWNRILGLPEKSLAGDKRVPKTQIIAQAKLTRAQQALLDKIAPVSFFASLQKSNSHIPGVRNAEYDIEAVIFLRCALRSSKGISEAAGMLHGCFPNPTVILADGMERGTAGISVAIRRKSLAEHGAFVTEDVCSTGLFEPSDKAYREFLSGISLQRLPQTSLLDYVRALGDRCMRARYVRTLGFYPDCRPSDQAELARLVGELDSIQRRISELEAARRDKGTSLNESAKLRVSLRDEKKIAEGIVRQIRDLSERR